MSAARNLERSAAGRLRVRGAGAALALALLCATPAAATVERFAVVIGHNRGAPGEALLRYAEEDARKVQEVMADLGGFPPENLVLLQGQDAGAVRRALIAANERVRAATSRPGAQAMLLVYYSGHADARALHLGGSELALAELEGLVRGSAATFRVLVLDACRSGALTRVKGGSAAPPLDIRLDERLRGEGAVFLTSSSENEDAQESEALRGSFFTHYLVSGLLGAADEDGDGRVVLEEAYRYAYAHTLRASSATVAGPQHPTFQYDLRGQGDVVLTTLDAGAQGRGALEFPDGRSYLVFDEARSGAVVAEVGALDARRRLHLRAGRYFVRGRGRDHLLEGHVEVPLAQARRVEDAGLRRSDYARLVRKGGGPALAHAPRVGFQARTPFWPDSRLCTGAFAAWALEAQALTLTPRAGYCQGRTIGTGNTSLQGEADLALRATRAWDLPAVTLEAGVSAGAALLVQRDIHIDRPGMSWRPPTQTSLAGQLGLVGSVTRDLPARLFVVLDVEAQGYVFRVEGTEDANPTAFLTLRGGLSLGRRW